MENVIINGAFSTVITSIIVFGLIAFIVVFVLPKLKENERMRKTIDDTIENINRILDTGGLPTDIGARLMDIVESMSNFDERVGSVEAQLIELKNTIDHIAHHMDIPDESTPVLTEEQSQQILGAIVKMINSQKSGNSFINKY